MTLHTYIAACVPSNKVLSVMIIDENNEGELWLTSEETKWLQGY